VRGIHPFIAEPRISQDYPRLFAQLIKRDNKNIPFTD